MPPSTATGYNRSQSCWPGGGRGGGGSSVLMYLVCLVHLREMDASSARLHVAERRTIVTKGPPAAAAAAEEVAVTTTTCPIPSTTCPSAARCVLDRNISDESMGHLPRLHGLCATLPWPCATDPWATGGWLHGPCATAPWATCDGSMGHRRLAHCRLSSLPSSRDGGVE